MSTATKITLTVLGIGVIISLLIWKCNNKPIVPIPITHDTVIVRTLRIDTVKDSKLEIPTVVTYYDTVYKRDTSLSLLILHDTVKLVKHDSVIRNISSVFLEAYPASPKIILGEFGQNNISLTLLNTDGMAFTKKYTPDFSKYNYEFSGSELKFYPIKNESNVQKALSKFTTQVFLSTTYNPFTNGATLRVEGSIMINKIGATIFNSFSTDQNPKFNTGIGLKVQLK